MNDYPIGSHTISLERAFPRLKPEEREAMREFLDGYCEIALACPHFPHTNNTQLAAAVAVGK